MTHRSLAAQFPIRSRTICRAIGGGEPPSTMCDRIIKLGRIIDAKAVKTMSQLDVVAMRPFVPARDFGTSLQFYTELGFAPFRLGDGLASMHFGNFAFLLQDYYVKEWADNFMMHVLLRDVDAWWTRTERLKLADHFAVRAPAEPKVQDWGLIVSYVWDPAGVLWHFAQDPQSVRSESA